MTMKEADESKGTMTSVVGGAWRRKQIGFIFRYAVRVRIVTFLLELRD